VVIQRQLGHADRGITSVYLRGIDNTEIIHTVHERPAPMIPADQRTRSGCTSQSALPRPATDRRSTASPYAVLLASQKRAWRSDGLVGRKRASYPRRRGGYRLMFIPAEVLRPRPEGPECRI